MIPNHSDTTGIDTKTIVRENRITLLTKDKPEEFITTDTIVDLSDMR